MSTVGGWIEARKKRVLELMQQRIKGLSRSASAQRVWVRFLKNAKSKSFLDKVKGLFR